jgi:hypothetical protein
LAKGFGAILDLFEKSRHPTSSTPPEKATPSASFALDKAVSRGDLARVVEMTPDWVGRLKNTSAAVRSLRVAAL